MSTTDLDRLVGTWLTLHEVAERLGATAGRVRQMVRARELVAIRREPGTELVVPAGFVHADRIVKGLGGTLTLLSDAGFDAEESIRWLVSEDPAIGRAPLDALLDNRPKDVHRQAQLLGF